MGIQKYEMVNFQKPNSDADIEKCLLKAFKFTRRKDSDGYDIYPDDKIHTIFITHTPYELVIENFKKAIQSYVRSYEKKGFELTKEQTALMVNGLASNYIVYGATKEESETYASYIMRSIDDGYNNDGVLDVTNRETGFSEKFSHTATVIDYLGKVELREGMHGEQVFMTKAKSIAMAAHREISYAHSALGIELKTLDYSERLKRIAAPNVGEVIRDYVGKNEDIGD